MVNHATTPPVKTIAGYTPATTSSINNIPEPMVNTRTPSPASANLWATRIELACLVGDAGGALCCRAVVTGGWRVAGQFWLRANGWGDGEFGRYLREDSCEVVVRRCSGADVAARGLREQPSVFEHFVEDFGLFKPSGQRGGYRADNRFVDLHQQLVRSDHIRHRRGPHPFQVAAAVPEVAEQAAAAGPGQPGLRA